MQWHDWSRPALPKMASVAVIPSHHIFEESRGLLTPISLQLAIKNASTNYNFEHVKFCMVESFPLSATKSPYAQKDWQQVLPPKVNHFYFIWLVCALLKK